MARGKKLNDVEKAEIKALKEHSGMSNREIARNIKRSEKVVRNFLKDRIGYGQKKSTGRPSQLSVKKKRLLIRTAANSMKSSRQLREELQLKVSARRVRQVLNESNHLRYMKLASKPLLSERNIASRKHFAISHMSWTQEWRKIIFSDEKKFNLDGPDGWACYWHDLRTEPKIFSKRQSGGGSVMVWGAIGYRKKVDLIFVENRMNAEAYKNMVGPLFPAWGYEMAGIGWQFQQDNAPIHVAKVTLAHFKDLNIRVFEGWPSKSPDMNIIENVWSLLARAVYKEGKQYSNKVELRNSIIHEWRNLEQMVTRVKI